MNKYQIKKKYFSNMNNKLYFQIISVLLLCILQSACTYPSKISPTDLRAFTSDGCSHYPDGPTEQPTQWRACCVAHDRIYWAGGTRQQRSLADATFKQCVIDNGVSVFKAQMMWLGVRVAGGPIWPGSFRWAYGWPYYRGYAAIMPAEQLAIERLGN